MKIIKFIKSLFVKEAHADELNTEETTSPLTEEQFNLLCEKVFAKVELKIAALLEAEKIKPVETGIIINTPFFENQTV